MSFTSTSIGVIRTPFRTKEDAPIQGAFHPENVGDVVVFPEFAEGLADIDGFSHLILLYEFDRAAAVEMKRQTFLGDEAHGLWATRHPARTNPIGLTVVKLLGRVDAVLTVAGIDVLDETPLLDIKPYVEKFDLRVGTRGGWTDQVSGTTFRQRGERREDSG